MPTVEQCKKSMYLIYNGWKCVRCERKKETFNHVWLCNSQKKKLKDISKKAAVSLLEKINNYEEYDLKESKFFEFLDKEKFLHLIFDECKLTLRDIIKGIFPLSLSEFLKRKVKMNDKDRLKVSTDFLDFIYDETKLIWEERCERQIEKEKRLKINKRKKLSANNVGLGNVLNTVNIPKRKAKIRAEGLLNGIYFNQKPLDFIVHVNRTFKLIIFVLSFNF